MEWVKENVLLAIDVGNTTVSIGIFRGRRLIYTRKILTKKPASKRYYLSEFKKLIKPKKITDIIMCSVVPDTTKVLKALFKGEFNLRPKILGEDLIVPVKNLYKNPKQVGQDRLVNAYAGYKKFGGGLIIVDFGTAVTFDVVSKRGEYVGGIIMPGIETALNALSEKAALLPKIKLKEPKNLIGKDTTASMLSGIIYGYAALCNGLIAKIKKEMIGDYKVVLTGGHARFLSKFCAFDYMEPSLILEGLNFIYNEDARIYPN